MVIEISFLPWGARGRLALGTQRCRRAELFARDDGIRADATRSLQASSNNPFASVEQDRAFAEAWGADYRLLGEQESIESAANLGMRDEGHARLMDLRRLPRAGASA